MSSDLLSRSILDVATPFSDNALRSFDTDAAAKARQQEKRQAELSHALEKKSELLASPDKIDNMVSSQLEDVFPLTKKPKAIGYDRVAGIDDSLKQADHPMSGLGAAVKDRFKAALQDKNLALASPVEILNSVKQDALAQKDEKGKSLLERSYDYKMKKDHGGLFSFHPSKFIPGMEKYSDKNTVALPGYEEYAAKNEKHSTSITESVALGAAGALVGAGLTALTGGAAAPMAVLATRMAMAGATAVPEFAAFDAAANYVKDTEFGKSEDTGALGKLGAEMALGLIAAVGVSKGIHAGLGKGLTKAIEAGKVSEEMVGRLKNTGLASDAIKVFEARTTAAKELAVVQAGIESANAGLARKATTQLNAQKIMVAASADEAGLSMREFIARLSDDYAGPVIKPLYADVMGVTPEILERAKTNPAALFTLIENPEVEAKVMERIAGGMTAQEAVLKGFHEEASLRLYAAGEGEALEALKAREFYNPEVLPERNSHIGDIIPGNEGGKVYGWDGAETTESKLRAAREAEEAVKGVRLGFPLGKGVKGSSVKPKGKLGETSLDNSHTPMDKLLSGEKVFNPEILPGQNSRSNLGDTIPGRAPYDTVYSWDGLGAREVVKNPEILPRSNSNLGDVVPGTSEGVKTYDWAGDPETAASRMHAASEAGNVAKGVRLELPQGGKAEAGKTVKSAGGGINLTNTFTETVVDAAGKKSTSVNVAGLAAAGLLAGGMTLFGAPEKSEASTGQAVAEFGKGIVEGLKGIYKATVDHAAFKLNTAVVEQSFSKVGAFSKQPVKSVNIKLGDLIQHDDLFTKFPAARGVDVTLKKDPSKTAGRLGLTVESENRIILYDYEKLVKENKVESTLVHEVEHMLGANEEQAYQADFYFRRGMRVTQATTELPAKVIGQDGSSVLLKDLEKVITNTTDATKPLVEGASLANKTIAEVAALAASTGLLSLLSPSDAEASVGSAISKAVASKGVVQSLLEETGGKLENVFKAMFERRLVSMPVAPGTTVLPQMQQQFYQAPAIGRSVEAVRSVVGKTKTGFDGLAGFMSTNFFSQVYGTTEKSVAVQLASMQNAMTNNIHNGTNVAKYIIEGVKGIKPEHSNEIAEFMKPIQSAFDEVAIPLRASEIETINAQKVIKNVQEALKDGKYSAEDAEMLIKEQSDKVTRLKELYHEYQPQFAAAESKYNAAKEELIQKYPSARISFAIEDHTLLKKYEGLYTHEEKVAVAQFQEFYKAYKVRANEVGLETITGPYINHSRDNTVVNQLMQERLERFGVTVNKNIPMTEFFSRSKYSKQMIPDISRNAFDYVPDTERRIQGADFWRKGKQDGWDAFSKNEFIRSNKVWSDYFDRIKASMVPPPQTTLNQWSNRYAAVETLRLLAFLPSAPFKHLFKNEGTWATLGFTHSMKMIPEAVMVSARNTANDMLRAKGLTEKMLPKGALDDFTNSMIKQRSMINPLSDLERFEGVTKGVDKWLDKLNNTGGIGIRAVEAFDRTHTVQAALDMALKKGMTAEQAMYGIYDTILKNNFLGGSLNPIWMHNPKIRALALFQNTPFKIMERRLANAYKTGQDVKTAWGVIKGQNVGETLKELTDIGTWVKGAQNEFKKNMIFDALTSTKDSMGNSTTQIFMKEFLITGAILGAGSATGVDFSGHSFHLPFIKAGKHEPTIATSPVIDASWKTVTGKASPGHEGDEEKEFFVSRFVRHWTSSTGGAQPLVLNKFKRISAGDIPEIYRDNKFRYLFSIPGKEEH